jgi:hypothetical protein
MNSQKPSCRLQACDGQLLLQSQVLRRGSGIVVLLFSRASVSATGKRESFRSLEPNPVSPIL